MLFGLAGWLSSAEMDAPAEVTEQSSVPPVFQALNGKNVAVIIGSIQDIAVTDMAPGANILQMTTIPPSQTASTLQSQRGLLHADAAPASGATVR